MEIAGKQAENIPEAMEIDKLPLKTDGDKVLELLTEKLKEIEKGVLKKEPRFILRVLSSLLEIRKLLTDEVLSRLLAERYSSKDELALWIHFEPTIPEGKKHSIENMLPEIDAFLHLLVLLKLIDSCRYRDALSCSDKLVRKICEKQRRTMEPIAARIYFYQSRVYELQGQLEKIRTFQFSRLRTCTLKNDVAGQAVLINCILRNYLHYSLYDVADKFISKVKFPETASNNEWARFLYYLAQIKAVRLEYSDAHKYVNLALRKAPESRALGFKQAAHKLSICVELLLGDIPEKKNFNVFKMRNSLEPYLNLTQAVRDGDLVHFGEVVDKYGNQFQNDKTFNLILRLRRNVIKIAVRGIGQSYARITPAQIAKKLGLDNSEEALYIVAKAIRDGVIEAYILPNYMVSRDQGDIYRTLTPTKFFHKRILACLELHNESITGMRYPSEKYEPKASEEDELEVEEEADDDMEFSIL